MNTKISNKITLINYTMTLFVVCLHSLYLYSDKLLLIFYNYIRTLGDMAVPTFFVISSFLLFRKGKNEPYINKIKKRVKSLIVPYFIWSTFFYLIYLSISNIPVTSKFLNDNYVVFSIKGMISSIIFCKYIPQFWYIRLLFIIVILSFFIYYIMKKGYKIVPLIIIFILFSINYFFDFPTVNVFTWLPLFWLIAWITYFYEDKIYCFFEKENNLIGILTGVVTLIMAGVISRFDVYSNIYYTWRIMSPIIIIFIFKNIHINFNIKWRHRQGFFIFTLHYFIISFIRKIFLLIFGESILAIVITYILTVIFAVLISLLCANIIQKKYKKLNKILSGSRGD